MHLFLKESSRNGKRGESLCMIWTSGTNWTWTWTPTWTARWYLDISTIRLNAFHIYVHNCVRCIHQSTTPKQWSYVCSEDNPADYASRSVPASSLMHATWFTGPAFFYKPDGSEGDPKLTYELVNPESDTELRSEVSSYLTQSQKEGLNLTRFQRFSSMCSLTRAIATLIHIAKTYKQNDSSRCKRWHHCMFPQTPDELSQAIFIIIKAAQEASEITDISHTVCVQKQYAS